MVAGRHRRPRARHNNNSRDGTPYPGDKNLWWMALVVYEPPAYTPLTSPTRIFDLPHSGRVTMTQHWQENGTRTGGAVWDAAQVLGHYLDEHHTRWINRSSLEVRP